MVGRDGILGVCRGALISATAAAAAAADYDEDDSGAANGSRDDEAMMSSDHVSRKMSLRMPLAPIDWRYHLDEKTGRIVQSRRRFKPN